ncbi:MAG: sulfite exporter TauE/SafE family protein [Gemmatimonadaceae bacterium]
MTLALAVLVASLLGSVHCAGMCGAFVCFYTARAPGVTVSWPEELSGHAAYNLGRLVSYLTLGITAGALGSALDGAGMFAGVQRAAAIVAGASMVIWGGYAVLSATDARLPGLQVPIAWRRAMGSVVLRASGKPPLVRATLTGLATTLLPCGWLYAFVLTASAAGSPARAALVMVFFWLGTMPMMLAAGMGARRLMGKFGRRMPMISGATVMVLGLLTIAGRIGAAPHAAHVMSVMP